MSTKERAHYLNTFKRNGKTIAENIAIDMQDILKEKFNCVVQAIAEMKQKPSLFQRIKNWFANQKLDLKGLKV